MSAADRRSEGHRSPEDDQLDAAAAELGFDAPPIHKVIAGYEMWSIMTDRGTVRWRSAPMAALLGVDPGQTDELYRLDMMHPTDSERRRTLRSSIETWSSFDPIRVRVQRHGAWRRLEFIGHAFLADDGSEMVIVAATDVTAILEAELPLTALLDGLSQPAGLTDGREFLWVNEAYRVRAGLEPGEVPEPGRSYHPDDRETVLDTLHGLTADQRPRSLPVRFRTATGDYEPVLSTAVPLATATRSLYLITNIDIQDPRVAETHFRTISDLARDIVFRIRVEPELGFVYISPSFEEVSGYQLPDDINELQLRPGRMVHPDDFHQMGPLLGGEREQATIRCQHADGHLLWLELRVRHERDAEGRVVSVWGIARDVTEIRATEETLLERSTHDALTGLPNRSRLAAELERAMGSRSAGRPDDLALLIVNLDRFRDLNDAHGHDVGDGVLCATALRFREIVADRGFLARLGADEFAVVVHGPRAADEGRLLADELVASANGRLVVEHRDLVAPVSVGMALADRTVSQSGQLLRRADRALARAKTRGRARVEVFDGDLADAEARRSELVSELRAAVDHRQVEVHYQPEIDLRDGSIRGVEALARWSRPDGTPVSPAEFIPLAEEAGLILELGNQVLRRSAESLARWRRMGHELELKVNLSARQLAEPSVVADVLTALADVGAEPDAVCLEVTESVLVTDPVIAAQRLDELRRAGARVAIDDFGTGFSSLSYLDQLPLDVLKIDRSFTDRLDAGWEDRRATVIPTAIIDLAAALGVEVTAEGIETPRQRERLLDLGCRQGQGFLFSRPVPAADIDLFLASGARLMH